jgi:hypothetical protein
LAPQRDCSARAVLECATSSIEIIANRDIRWRHLE